MIQRRAQKRSKTSFNPVQRAPAQRWKPLPRQVGALLVCLEQVGDIPNQHNNSNFHTQFVDVADLEAEAREVLQEIENMVDVIQVQPPSDVCDQLRTRDTLGVM